MMTRGYPLVVKENEKEMKLFKKIEFKDRFWYIIELDEDEEKEFGHKFAVSEKAPSKYLQNKWPSNLEYRLEWLYGTSIGLAGCHFDTALECYYHIKLVEAYSIIDSLQKIPTDPSAIRYWFGYGLIPEYNKGE